MEQFEVELIEKYMDQNEELKTLWDDHMVFEKRLDKLSSKPFVNGEEEAEYKDLKKRKLAGKTRMKTILAQYA